MGIEVGYLAQIKNPTTIVTPLGDTVTYPEARQIAYTKYGAAISLFTELAANSSTSAQLLERIRTPQINGATRVSLLKLFRRCVAPNLDTETTKKINKIATAEIVAAYGNTFKPITLLKEQFAAFGEVDKANLAVLIGEYDTRGQSGYELSRIFFGWFEENYSEIMTISGPRGAGPDVELHSVFPDFEGSFPCDFVIRDKSSDKPIAVGFIRYDSTRGGAQSDDRTGGNANKVAMARDYVAKGGKPFRIVFVSDGPGLAHGDIWTEACKLDGDWDDNVRVTSLKLASLRVTPDWLLPAKS
jgi:hypothetical protein